MWPGTCFTLIENDKKIGSCFYRRGTTLSTIDKIREMFRYYNKCLAGQRSYLPTELFALRFFCSNLDNKQKNTGYSYEIDINTLEYLWNNYSKEYAVPRCDEEFDYINSLGKIDLFDDVDKGAIKVDIDLTRKIITTDRFCKEHDSLRDYKIYHGISAKTKVDDFAICNVDPREFSFCEIDDLQFFLMNPDLVMKDIPSFKILSGNSIFELFIDL